ncbi:carbohydrate kinase family protein [Subsaximicrobium wynnwilliamsii]|uniref:Carbohydrate kinase family protein n=1 Tax=Subsaximicrobium wynnwilliamsii TaxID=291179 RepID=A0A5C6ZDH3_9FLAO|nr:carbohydrate kinase family protein [Subsaximicrobium wynnwilliamsii]TXD81844.1 carbohydrate kinase family protein [Subsaximicrobium wynnwilliamsii]TXD87513.1 carbohydrate kinase family protein [Subsaximicrobium wynnwilliamsii]TXE01196.1 carbohydrate kinase family protein [Subsaximicrobium wynnwilliamsii]
MNKGYKIAVVGPIPQDTIITHKNEVITKYGCVSHPTIALAKLLEGKGEVIPISNIHKKDHDAINVLFEPYPAINKSGINSEKDQGTIIELNFIDQNNRLEKQLANMHPITAESVAPFLDADCFVFVPITDFEIELDALKHIKNNSAAKIIFDAHGTTTYVDNEQKRLRKYWKDREDWLPYIDVLKMNLEESLCCWFEKDYSDVHFHDEDRREHLDDFAANVLNQGVTVLYVTLDSKGCAIYSKKEGTIQKDFVASVPVKDVIDTTGCGDSFAGGLAFGLTVYNDPIKAAHYANTLGSRRTQGKGFDVFKSLEETEAIIKAHYHK